ncbi:sensor histidine kinase [Lysobacter terrestris]|uniref:Sensor histidine kinase n=1 Tax=Agrilutibacter terrestris TaxID=2865112 RepID=A0A7H0G1G6_9GAMM|nr:sensor histidine kinase [Lysobacter terrestris]
MSQRLRTLLHPFNLAGLFTWGAVALSLQWLRTDALALAWTLLVGFLLALLAQDLLRERHRGIANALLWLEAVAALVLVWLDPRIGTAQVLLVVWTAQIAACWSLRSALAAVVLVDVVTYAILRDAGLRSPLVVMGMYAGFQAFAALCAYYATSAEQARDRLALVNADLLATRALLADSARDAERLRVARELHDVAGHKLTALTLNLRALAADPALAPRHELQVAQQMSAELLGDIRGVVQALRDASGLDLGTALRALAAPMPRPSLRLAIGDDVHISDPAVAEAVLRLVQEALTNSARHAEADTVSVALQREGNRLSVKVEDDGYVRGTLREGNGLSGMRERLAAAGGTLALSTTARGALRIDASLPL